MSLDHEKIVGDYLRDVTGERIVGKTPDDPSESWVRLTQLNALAVGGHRSDHLIEVYCQLDCYASAAGVDGSQQREANEIRQAIREALIDMPNQNGSLGATVTGVDIRGDSRQPDSAFEKSRERFILTVVIWMHP